MAVGGNGVGSTDAGDGGIGVAVGRVALDAGALALQPIKVARTKVMMVKVPVLGHNFLWNSQPWANRMTPSLLVVVILSPPVFDDA